MSVSYAEAVAAIIALTAVAVEERVSDLAADKALAFCSANARRAVAGGQDEPCCKAWTKSPMKLDTLKRMLLDAVPEEEMPPIMPQVLRPRPPVPFVPETPEKAVRRTAERYLTSRRSVGVMSTGETLAIAYLFDKPSLLVDWTLLGAIDRIGPEWWAAIQIVHGELYEAGHIPSRLTRMRRRRRR